MRINLFIYLKSPANFPSLTNGTFPLKNLICMSYPPPPCLSRVGHHPLTVGEVTICMCE